MGFGKNQPKQMGQPGKKMSLSKYKYAKQASDVRLKGAERFGKELSDFAAEKKFRQLGKTKFKTRGGDTIRSREIKGIVKEELKKAGIRGLSGKQLRERLVKKHGLKYEDTKDIVKAVTHHKYVPPQEGPTEAEIQRNIEGARAVLAREGDSIDRSMADDILKSKSDDALKRAKVTGDNKLVGHEQLGIKDVEKTGAILQSKQGTDTSIESQDGKISAGSAEHSQTSIGSEDKVTSITGGSQKKEDDGKVKDLKKAKAKRGGPVQLAASGAGGTRRMSGSGDGGAQFIQRRGGEIESSKKQKERINKEMADTRDILGGVEKPHSEKKRMLMEALRQRWGTAELHEQTDDEQAAPEGDQGETSDNNVVQLDDYRETGSPDGNNEGEEPKAAAGGG